MSDLQQAIVLSSLSRFFGPKVAVDNLSLEVTRGEIFSFLGMNGAGKTTTLRMMVGILRPTSGRIRIAGMDLAKTPEQVKRTIGYIPDRPYMYGRLTAREFLMFVAALYGITGEHAESASEKYLEKYELLNVQDQLIDSYSHGMKQRLATCAALLHDPSVLIVDEPMVGLDPHGAKLLKESFRSYAKQGVTIFLSTHSLNVAEEISDRIAIIHKAKLLCIGSVSELKDRYGESSIEQVFLKITGSEYVEDDDEIYTPAR